VRAPRFVLDWIERGFPITFGEAGPPPRRRLANRIMRPEEVAFVDAELERLVKEGAVRPATEDEVEVVSPLGVVPKKNGKSRLIVDMRYLNAHLETPPKFRLEDLGTLAPMVKANDLFMTLDLESGYHHVEMDREAQRYLGVRWRGVLYVYTVLPFGLSLSPWAFTKLLRPVVERLRRNTRCLLYLDDMILLARGPAEAVRVRRRALRLLRRLGLFVNFAKSSLEPSPRCEFLGLLVSSRPRPSFVVPRDKLRDLRRAVARTLATADTNGGMVRARALARLAGTCAALSRALMPTRLMLREVHRCIRSARAYDDLVALTGQARQDLHWWARAASTWNGRAMLPAAVQAELGTDASDTGWGAVADGEEAAGWWSPEEARASINARELWAVGLGLRALRHRLRNKVVRVKTDSFTTAAYLNNLGGRFETLDRVARSVLETAWSLGVTLRAEWLPGVDNTEPDRLSRLSVAEEWTVARSVFRALDGVFGPHTVDRFASRANAQLPRYDSRLADPSAEATDALSVDWRADNNWVAPPFRLLGPTLLHIKRTRAWATVVAPVWRAAPWFALLRRMEVRSVPLPSRQAVFRPPVGSEGPPEPLRNTSWRLRAWRVCGARA
jgi:hypothetical protein